MSGEGRWTVQDWPRLGVTAGILGAFAWALVWHYSNGLEETLKNLAVMAVGFWLGSSRGAQTQAENVGKALDAAAASAPDPAPRPVVVTNAPDNPVPTEAQ